MYLFLFLVLQLLNRFLYHSVKSFQIRIYFWSVFSYIRIEYPNTGKYGPKITRIWTLFTQCILYPGLYIQNKATRQIEHNNKGTFQEERDFLFFWSNFKKEKAFSLHFKRLNFEWRHTFCLDKSLSCYEIVGMFVSQGVFLVISS